MQGSNSNVKYQEFFDLSVFLHHHYKQLLQDSDYGTHEST